VTPSNDVHRHRGGESSVAERWGETRLFAFPAAFDFDIEPGLRITSPLPVGLYCA
jgi:hypothetical protein